jgi:hypothetical protein
MRSELVNFLKGATACAGRPNGVRQPVNEFEQDHSCSSPKDITLAQFDGEQHVSIG